MGYIAPVTQFDYIQYANRTIEAGKKVRIVNATTPIQSIRFDQVLEDETGRYEKKAQVIGRTEEKLNGAGSYKNHLVMKVKEELTVEITGKGGYFNKMI